MRNDRREFLKQLGVLGACTGAAALSAGASEHGPAAASGSVGVLVDLAECIGCRQCEHACKKANGIDPGALESYVNAPPVAGRPRRPEPDAFTVVNAWEGRGGKPVYAKVNCLHCNHPACASACIVGALHKTPEGPVAYDGYKCIGCRYCMVACPFQIPAYEYHDALAPLVRKCFFCNHRLAKGQLPGCVEACPRQALRFGKRSELLDLAHEKIASRPDLYIGQVYGEHEVGGTSWLYLSPVPFEKAGFVKLAREAPPALTESIQHGVFKHGLPPLALYGTLGALMWWFKPRAPAHGEGEESPATQRRIAAAEEGSADGNGWHDGNGESVQPQGTEARMHECTKGNTEDGGDETLGGHGQHEHHEEAAPVRRKLLTPGVFVLLGLILTGLGFGLYRFIFGIGASTNLDQQYPWGLWIGIDVASGVALAAGGFTSAFLTHILWRGRYHAVARPALLTAMLGYTFVVIGLQCDLGRYWNVWRPMIHWQGNSVLFEVGMCVMCYLNVLYLEFAPIACERYMKHDLRFPRITRLATFLHARLEKIMFALIIAGCCLSCLHQSSLGNLLVIAPSKLHPLWWTPLSPLLFLLSAIAVGFPMVIWESLFASWSLKLKPEMSVLGPLARFIPFTLGIYLAVKVGDVINRGAYVHLAENSLQSICWLFEVGAGVALPMIMMMFPRVRRSPGLLFIAVTLIVLGVVFNRVNVFLIGYRPPYATKPYFPSIGEFAVTVGLIATLMLVYRVIVTFFPVISHHAAKPREEAVEEQLELAAGEAR